MKNTTPSRTLTERVERAIRQLRRKYNIDNRLFTKADFYRICEGEDIYLLTPETYAYREGKVKILPDFKALSGLYFTFPGLNASCIYLRCFWLKRFDIFTAYHELGHHLIPSRPLKSDIRFALRESGDVVSIRPKGDHHEAYKNSAGEIAADLFAELCTGRKR